MRKAHTVNKVKKIFVQHRKLQIVLFMVRNKVHTQIS